MTEKNAVTNNGIRAELMALVQDAARTGYLTAADIEELEEYARRQLKRESDGTPEAEIA